MTLSYFQNAPGERAFLDAMNTTDLCGLNQTLCGNDTLSSFVTPEESTLSKVLDVAILGLTAFVLGLMILVTVIGNVFVIAAILLEKNLQNVANYLIVSLAVADLMVACLVMPLGAVYVISKDWTLGPELCDMWTLCDVLCCTASILHLVAIAVDRYWAVTNVEYIHTRNMKKIGTMIGLVWTVALIVSLAPQFGWKDPEYETRIKEQKCLVSQDVGYQIFATFSTFYLPLFVILVLYWKIFQAARQRIRRNRNPVAIQIEEPDDGDDCFCMRIFYRLIGANNPQDGADDLAGSSLEGPSTATIELAEQGGTSATGTGTSAFTITAETSFSGPAPRNISGSGAVTQAPRTAAARRTVDLVQAQRERKEALDTKRERKAAKTLAVVTGAFVICWLPFFITALLTPMVGPINDTLANIILWLGYFNSTLNPVIYTVFSPDFRQAFKKILLGKRRGV